MPNNREADANSADAAPATVPPRHASTSTSARRRQRRTARLDRNRPFEVLAILLIYILVVHYSLKFATFFLPEETPSRDEMLGLRGATGALGFSFRAASMPKRRLSFQHVVVPADNGMLLSNSRSGSIIKLRSTLRETDSIGTIEDGTLAGANNSTSTGQCITNKTATDNQARKDSTNSTQRQHKRPRIPVLSYQDTYVIVSKPSGMTMHHNSNTRWGRSKSPVLQTTIHKQLSRKPYLVHRLDHRTSGACILGFSSEKASELHGRLRREEAVKLYVALVRGDLREKFQCAASAKSVGDTIDMSDNGDESIVGSRGKAPDIMMTGVGQEKEHGQTPSTYPPCIDLSSSEYNGRITVNIPMKVDDVLKEAQTEFYFLASTDLEEEEGSIYKENESPDAITNTTIFTVDSITPSKPKTPYTTKSLTLLLCRPRTGRTHQIRRHIRKALKAPIIGDSEHGDSRVNRYWRTNIGLDRLALHCWYLGLPSEEESTGGDDDVGCIAPLTSEFAEALQHETLRSLWEEATHVEPRLMMEPYDERGGTYGRNYRKRQRR